MLLLKILTDRYGEYEIKRNIGYNGLICKGKNEIEIRGFKAGENNGRRGKGKDHDPGGPGFSERAGVWQAVYCWPMAALNSPSGS
jgi:hypothetical protein